MSGKLSPHIRLRHAFLEIHLSQSHVQQVHLKLKHSDVVLRPILLAPHHPEPQAVGPGLQEAEGDLRPRHGGDPPLVDLEDGVAGPEAALPSRTFLDNTRKYLSFSSANPLLPGQDEHEPVLRVEAVAEVHSPGLGHGGSLHEDLVPCLGGSGD